MNGFAEAALLAASAKNGTKSVRRHVKWDFRAA